MAYFLWGFCTCATLVIAYMYVDEWMHRERKRPTNADRIRKMSDEELAGLGIIGKRFCTIPTCEEHHGNCTECSLEWLKKEGE